MTPAQPAGRRSYGLRGEGVLTALLGGKADAFRHAGYKIATDVEIVLAAKTGFGSRVEAAGADNPHIHLIRPDDLLT
jgi:hypothetical protein